MLDYWLVIFVEAVIVLHVVAVVLVEQRFIEIWFESFVHLVDSEYEVALTPLAVVQFLVRLFEAVNDEKVLFVNDERLNGRVDKLVAPDLNINKVFLVKTLCILHHFFYLHCLII